MLKSIFPYSLITAILLVFTACQQPGCTDPIACNYDPNATQDDGTCDYSCLGNSCMNGYIIKQGTITANETWDPNCMYRLVGHVVVESGVILTILPGTIIKADSMPGSFASSLIIEKGAQLIANGTATEPIIFTSMLDNIQPGMLSGTNLTDQHKGFWGGIIILGDAPISSATGGGTSDIIEGLPPSTYNSTYGGNNPSDNSGSLNYVSIRHTGIVIGAGNELNALTLAGVGNGTNISNIELVASLDDGVECFGGTVNLTNVISGLNGDDCIDIDQGYAGNISNFRILVDVNGDEAIEVDGPEGTINNTALVTMSNGTISVYNGTLASSDFKAKAQGNFSNIIFDGSVKFRSEYDTACTTPLESAFTHLTDTPPTLVFNNCSRNSINVYSLCTVSSADQTAAENAFPSLGATGATTTGWSWSWLAINGYL